MALALIDHTASALESIGLEQVVSVMAGGEDRRLAWYDLDLSAKPYKALRYHKAAVRGAAYHRSYPLFASSSDDGAVHVFHGAVYQVASRSADSDLPGHARGRASS